MNVPPDDADPVLFARNRRPAAAARARPAGAGAAVPWRVLIVDDDPEVHSITQLVLGDVTYRDRPIELLSAHSAAEAFELMRDGGDVAVVLLDVVMESDDSGLQLARRIRHELGNAQARIILRTGQPGQAPEREIIVNYDINDYKAKTELTAQKLFTATIAALRSYEDLMTIEAGRRGLELIVESTSSLFGLRSLAEFAEEVLDRLRRLLGGAEHGLLWLAEPGSPAILAGAGRFRGLADPALLEHLFPDAWRLIAAAEGRPVRDGAGLALPIGGPPGAPVIAYLEGVGADGAPAVAPDSKLVELFCATLAVGFENVRLLGSVLALNNYNESILASLTDGVVTLDRTLTVTRANQAAARLLTGGAPPAGPAEALFGDANRWVLASIAKVAETGQPDYCAEAILQPPAGGGALVNLMVSPLLDEAGQPIGFLLVFEDITVEKRVRATMSRYMAKELVDRVLDGGDTVLQGTAQTATILFADIRGFTHLVEALSPTETVQLLNEYFSEMEDVIARHGGTLDKYIGDALMATFGVPVGQPSDPERALAAANEMLRCLDRLNARRRASRRPPIEIGIGLATGEVLAGSIGSVRRMDYTVIGDCVNLASRLESANKFYGTSTLVSGATIESVREPRLVRQIDLIRLKGHARPTPVYESLGHMSEDDVPGLGRGLAAFDEGIRRYREQNWSGAIRYFAETLELLPNDGPSWVYLDRCRHYRAQPPGEGWDGVWNMEEK